MSEFELIQRYFTQRQSPPSYVTLGIGDDCALMTPSAGMQLAISSDMLVAGRHFFPDADARMLGHKALAVNLSDLAAMGATPRAFTLALALPQVDESWLREFSQGLFALADRHHCHLIGGDTTKGPLNICITVLGDVPPHQALRRDSAKVGDDIWVSGTLGDARLALASYLRQQTISDEAHRQSAARLHQPIPRIGLGLALRGIAHAGIDISDGLIGDLGHILQRSAVGATLDCDALPFGSILAQQAIQTRYEYALAGGDDYELCFTAAPSDHAAVLAAAQRAQTPVTCIGQIEAQSGLRLVDKNKQALHLSLNSFDHFSS